MDTSLEEIKVNAFSGLFLKDGNSVKPLLIEKKRVFKEKENLSDVTNFWHSKIKLNRIKTIDLQNHLPSNGSFGWCQGACCDNSGNAYIVIAGYNTKADAHPQKYSNIIKVSITKENASIDDSGDIEIDHGNSMTYDTSIDSSFPILITGTSYNHNAWDGSNAYLAGSGSPYLYKLKTDLTYDKDNFFVKAPNSRVFNFFTCCGDRSENPRAAGIQNGTNTLYTYNYDNGSFSNPIAYVFKQKPGRYGGGGHSNSEYIYCCRSQNQDQEHSLRWLNWINCFTWNGEFLGEVEVIFPNDPENSDAGSAELEDLFEYDNALYAVSSTWNKVFIDKLIFYQFD